MTRILTPLVSAIALFAAAPAFAQDHSMHGMPGMAPPGEVPPAQEKKKGKAAARPRAQTPAPDATSAMDHSQHQASPAPQGDAAGQPQPASPAMPDMPGMDHSQHQDGAMPDMPGMDHSQHGQTAMPGMQMTGTALPAGNAPPPPPPSDHFADRDFPGAEMARSRDIMMKDSGGNNFGQVLLNLFEYQAHSGRDGYRWDGEGFYGGDINRLWLKSEGEGEFGARPGTDFPSNPFEAAVSPITKMSGWPGTVRSGPTITPLATAWLEDRINP